MHGEEINQKIIALDKRIVNDSLRIGEVEWSLDKTNEKFGESLIYNEKTRILVDALRTEL
jgi:hypothetical protein